jgi:hypothetical protein
MARVDLDKVRIAEAVYLRGFSCEDIAKKVKVSARQVNRWRSEHNWVEKREQLLENPRSVSDMLRERLRELVAVATATSQINVEQLDEIAKMTKLIKEIAGEGYQLLAATVEVMRLYLDFVRSHDVEDFNVVFRYAGEFFREMLRRERSGRNEFTQTEADAKGICQASR